MGKRSTSRYGEVCARSVDDRAGRLQRQTAASVVADDLVVHLVDLRLHVVAHFVGEGLELLAHPLARGREQPALGLRQRKQEPEGRTERYRTQRGDQRL